MDPHSRRSQFNQRAPKSGPKSVNYRFVDLMTQSKPTVGKRSTTVPKKPSPSGSASLLIQRPIATNSRIKQDEKYRKGMYLAFVNNALQQKSNVSGFIAITRA
jgi:RNA polymerase I-specific transcription initiation factor RRN3